ncbi:MAG: extracellular solute-binding protein [Halofilum sp. (in: g-proteobacteria)]|nr:extracellular solute-binding protein [Halofilum sp. (in: g-proteobacteria)]
MNRRCRAGRLLVMVLLCAPAAVAAPDSLTVATWGGAYEASQRKAYFAPFTAATGIDIETAGYRGGVEPLARNADRWDVVDMTMADHRRACAGGLLQPMPDGVLADAPDGTPPRQDFLPGSLTRCGVAHIVFSTVIAFDKRAFPGARPYRVGHLFEPDLYPGKRALQQRPDAILEWALRSYGVPVADLYGLLSTERGLRLAFRRLEQIREQIVWWRDPAEAVRLLVEQEVTMASGYNGRFFDAAVVRGQPLEIIWDGQVYELEAWGVPSGSDAAAAAWQFVRFATRTESLARQATWIAYGPARRSAARQVAEHAATGVAMQPHMPTTEAHLETAIRKDADWYARTRGRLDERFNAWLAAGTR